MSVSTPETFVLTGGSCVAQGDQIVLNLADHNIVATNSSGTITVTNSSLSSATQGARRFENLVRIANAAGAKLVYTAAA